MREIFKVMHLNILTCLLTSAFLVSSCGFFSEDPVEDSQLYRSPNLTTNCEMNANDFKYFLEKNIEAEINCLQDSFDSFIRYVRRENQSYITKSELTQMVNRFFPDDAATILDGISILFELNMLLMNDEIDRMATRHVPPLFNLARQLNREAVILNDLFKELDSTNYLNSREKIHRSILRIHSSLFSTINRGSSGLTKINITDFLNNLEERIGFTVDPLISRASLSLKDALLGGNREEINSQEVRELFNKMPELAMIGLDLFYASHEQFNKDQKWQLYDHYNQQISALANLFVFTGPDRFFIDSSLLVDLALKYAPKNIDMDKLINTFWSFKRHMVLGDLNSFSFKDLKTTLFFAQSAIEGLSLFEQYRFISDSLNQDSQLDEINSAQEWFYQAASARSDQFREFLYDYQIPDGVELMEFVKDVVSIFIRNDFNSSTPNIISRAISESVRFLNRTFNVTRLSSSWSDEVIEALFSFKTAILGGDKETLNTQQADDLFYLLPFMAKDAFALIHKPISVYDKEERRYYFLELAQITQRLREVYFFNFKNMNKEIISTREILLLADEFLRNVFDLDFSTFQRSLDETKERIIGGPRKYFLPEDLINTVMIAEDLLKRIFFFDVYYEANEELMSSSRAIQRVPIVFHPDLQHLTQAEIDKYREEFEIIAQTFRYFRDDQGYSYYGNYYRRHKNGFIETAVLRLGGEILINAFDFTGSGAVDLDEILYIIQVYEPVLEAINFLSEDMESFAEKTLLLSDLFQSTSNGTLEVDVNEFAEIVSLTLMSMKVGDLIVEHLKNIHYSLVQSSQPSVCQYQYNQNGKALFSRECYRRYFYEIIFEKIGLKEHLFKLHHYYRNSSTREMNEFLRNVEGFAIDVSDPDAPLEAKDISTIFGALLNIESTFNRFDINHNNHLDNNELLDAFVIYEEAIMQVANLSENRRRFSQSIFLFMVKNMEIPSTVRLLNFHYSPFIRKDRITASRLNVAALLFFLTNHDLDDDDDESLKSLQEWD